MIEDLKRVLARVQSDYEFYVQLRLDLAAVASYDLSAEERQALSDPELLTSVLYRMAADPDYGSSTLPSITITVQIPLPNLLPPQPPPPTPPSLQLMGVNPPPPPPPPVVMPQNFPVQPPHGGPPPGPPLMETVAMIRAADNPASRLSWVIQLMEQLG
jgi:hypothetical protein